MKTNIFNHFRKPTKMVFLCFFQVYKIQVKILIFALINHFKYFYYGSFKNEN